MAKPTNDQAGPKTISLALQGGGSHGAFTWGVLDHLLRDDRIAIEAVSGTSAGAMNAVMLADGYARGGAHEARKQLEKFWTGVSRAGGLATALDEVMDAMFSSWKMPGFDAWGMTQQVENTMSSMSPFGLNPLDINPLGNLLNELVDFDRLKTPQAIKLFLGATNVHTGRGRIFANQDISTEAVLASAAHPHLFQAVEVEGESYWDGGYAANPPLWPFYEGGGGYDILLVQVTPERRDTVPATTPEVIQRENEITFNATLVKELRAIYMVNQLLEQKVLAPGSFLPNLLHRIDASPALSRYGEASKYDTSLTFFETLKKDGEVAASDWLDAHFDTIGVRSTVDLKRDFEQGPVLKLLSGRTPQHTPGEVKQGKA